MVHCRRFHNSRRLAPPRTSSPGMAVAAQRVPVKPAVLEKERNSMAQVRAPSISKMEWGISGSVMKAS